MDGITLLREAEDAGLTVRADGDKLVIRGPKRAEPVARRLLAHKPEVMNALNATSAVAKAESCVAGANDEPQKCTIEHSGVVPTRMRYLVPAELSAAWREMYEERAAIRELVGGQAREHAEAEALKEVREAMRAAAKRHAEERADQGDPT